MPRRIRAAQDLVVAIPIVHMVDVVTNWADKHFVCARGIPNVGTRRPVTRVF